MKNKIIILAICSQLMACASLKYPNWEYVRIEHSVPTVGCVYKMQEACSMRTNACLNWHKQRAITFDANTVVINSSEKQKDFSASPWTGNVRGGDNESTVAEYYSCNSSKNIVPSTK